MAALLGWKSRKQIRQVLTRFHRIKTTNIEQQLQINALTSSADYVESKLSEAVSLSDCYAVLQESLNKVRLSEGLYLEFGVFQCTSVNFIAKKIESKIHGFDSFEGLPEHWIDGYTKGTFKLDINQVLPKIEENVKLHVGWFDKTLPEFVSQIDPDEKVTFLHVDCDLYSSTKTIFDYLGDRIVPGTVIVFDEYFNYPSWQQHEFKAFQEFVEARKVAYKYLCFNRYGTQAAVQII
jgi:hypothetical protein